MSSLEEREANTNQEDDGVANDAADEAVDFQQQCAKLQEEFEKWWSHPGSKKARQSSKDPVTFQFKSSNHHTVTFVHVPNGGAHSRWTGKRSIRDVACVLGKGDLEAGLLFVAQESIKMMSEESQGQIAPLTMKPFSKDETIAVMSTLDLCRDNMMTLGRILLMHYGGKWPFYNIRKCKDSLKYRAKMEFFDDFHNEGGTLVRYWVSQIDEALLCALQKMIDEGEDIGTAQFGSSNPKGIYLCESGDHGAKQMRMGFVVNAADGQGQGDFNVTSVINGKDTKEILWGTAIPKLFASRKKLRASNVIHVKVARDLDNKHVSVIGLIDKTLVPHLGGSNGTRLVFHPSPPVDAAWVVTGIEVRKVDSDTVEEAVIVPFHESAVFPHPDTEVAEVDGHSENDELSFTVKTYPITLICTGDCKFLCTMTRRDGHASSKCPFCGKTSSTWQQQRLAPEETAPLTLDDIKNGVPSDGFEGDVFWEYGMEETVPLPLHCLLGLFSDVYTMMCTEGKRYSDYCDEEHLLRASVHENSAFLKEAKCRLLQLDLEHVRSMDKTKDLEEQFKNAPKRSQERKLIAIAKKEEVQKRKEITKERQSLKDDQKAIREEKTDGKAMLEEFDEERGYDFVDFVYLLELQLKDIRIEKQAFRTNNFVGDHVRKFLTELEDIMEMLRDAFLGVKKPCVATETIDKFIAKYQEMFQMLDNIFALAEHVEGKLSDEEIEYVDKCLDRLSTLLRANRIEGVTVKLHILECDFIRSLRKWRNIAVFDEQPCEREHHLVGQLIKHTNARDFESSQQQIENRKSLKKSPAARMFAEEIKQARKRNFSEESVSKEGSKASSQAATKARTSWNG